VQLLKLKNYFLAQGETTSLRTAARKSNILFSVKVSLKFDTNLRLS
jgi:hypothetical protein